MSTPRSNPQPPAPVATIRGPGDYLLKAREITPSWVILYTATFALGLLCGAIRAAVAYPVLWLALKLLGEPTSPVNDLTLLAGYGPLVASVATLILPLGGWWWEQQLGGRPPSRREQAVFEDAIATGKQADPNLRPPRRWFVVDTNRSSGAAYADTLMLTRGLLESGYLEGVLAHELGHLNSSDARVTAALRRLTTPPRTRMPRGLRTICFLASGGLALWITRAPWAAYWRAREHQADHYAATLGQAASLARFLETHALDDDLPVPFLWLTDTSHPSTEHRIDRLS
jgi:Zn-dependent protease with chaperone function